MSALSTVHRILFLLLGLPLSASVAFPANGAKEGELAKLKAQIETAQHNSDVDTLLARLRQLRDWQMATGVLDSAMHTGLQITSISGGTADRTAMTADWQVLAKVQRRSGDLAGAIISVKKAILVAKTAANPGLYTRVSMDLLDLLLDAGRFNESKHLEDEVLAACTQAGDQAGQAMVLYRQGERLNRQGRSVDALPILQKALREGQSTLPGRESAMILFAKAKANAQLGQWETAHGSFVEGLELFPQACRTHPELLGLQARISEGQGNLPLALQLERAMVRVQDSLLTNAMAERMAGIRIMYEVRAKEEDAAALRKTNAGVQAALDDEQTTVRWLWVTLGAFSVGFLMLVMLRYGQAQAVKRNRLRSTLIADKAKELQVKSLELERQNLRLSQALMEDEERNRNMAGPAGTGELCWVELLLRTGIEHAPDQDSALALMEVRDRVKALSLLKLHAAKEGGRGNFNLKAHLTALSAVLLRKHGQAGNLTVNFNITDDDLLPEDLLPLSLFIHELMLITLAQVAATGSPGQVQVGLRRFGQQQFELLYTDESGNLSKEHLNTGSIGGDLIQALVRHMSGSIRLLKGDFTTLQFTFEQVGLAEFRKAS